MGQRSAALETHQARTEPAKKEAAMFISTSIPEAIIAGVHSMNQPQLSAAMATFGKMFAARTHVKTCHSYSVHQYLSNV